MAPADKFGDMIGPRNLLGLVRNTANFIFSIPELPSTVPAASTLERAQHRYGFVTILSEGERLEFSERPAPAEVREYFALCLAAHHATVATFVPTDVDSKIRGVLWGWRLNVETFQEMAEIALCAREWGIKWISTRATEVAGVGPVSGHNGEMLGVLAGALGTFIRIGDQEFVRRIAEAIDIELSREVTEFEYACRMPGRELDVLRIAMSIMHNLGDLDQGISFWPNNPKYADYRQRFGRLGHERQERYGGPFRVAGKLYRELMSSEGHRHYPLRQVAALRRGPELLLPLGPFLDSWGEKVGALRDLTDAEKGEVISVLAQGCKKIAGQKGYFRAIAGIARALDGSLERVIRTMPVSARHLLKDPEIRRHMALRQESFESSYRKAVKATVVKELEGSREGAGPSI